MKKLIIFFITLSLFSCKDEETVPIYDYYKNIPIIRGWTSDDVPQNFMIEIVLVYREDNIDLRTMINQLKEPFIDALRRHFTSLTEDDFRLENEKRIKREAVDALNEVLLNAMAPKRADKLRKAETLEELDLILDINIMQLQIFNLD